MTSKDEAALTHARELHQFFAELRSQNFNFYLILIGALTAAFMSDHATDMMQFGLSAGAAFISVVFFGLDTRNIEMIKDARDALEKLEPLFGVNIHTPDSWTKRQDKSFWERLCGAVKYNPKARLTLLSHKHLYRAVFVVTYCTAIVILWNHPLAFEPKRCLAGIA